MKSTLHELLGQGRRSFSFEFFPPKTDAGEVALWQALAELEPLQPTFVSVTYGAGGSTRDRTIAITARIAKETAMVPVGHLTCVGATADQLRGVIAEYEAAGVRNILALRGDPEGGPAAVWTPTPSGLTFASELVSLVRESGDFCVGVAAFPDLHPASASADLDIDVLLQKQAAGAEFAITQFFFDADSYFRLVDRAVAAGCTIPIIPGIMPVTNLAQIQRFAALSGAAFPTDLAARFEVMPDDRTVASLGIDLASELCQELLDRGAPGLHFYTLNRSTATREIYANLGVAPSNQG